MNKEDGLKGQRQDSLPRQLSDKQNLNPSEECSLQKCFRGCPPPCYDKERKRSRTFRLARFFYYSCPSKSSFRTAPHLFLSLIYITGLSNRDLLKANAI